MFFGRRTSRIPVHGRLDSPRERVPRLQVGSNDAALLPVNPLLLRAIFHSRRLVGGER